MRKKDLNIEKIIDRYLNNTFSKQDFIDLMESIFHKKGISEFERKLEEKWIESMKQNGDANIQERSELYNEASNIIVNSKKYESATPRFRFKVHYIIRYVASLVIIAAISTSTYLYINREHTEKKICDISIPVGEKKKIKLSDESDIYINSASTLKYPETFEENQRVVELIGEAFFNITPDKERPFIINTGQISIKVLGTSFNVRSYNEDEWIGVTISTGTVSVSILDENSSIQLTSNEELWINKKNHFFQKSKKDVLQASSWRDGYLYFDKAPVKDVINTLNRKYAVNIILENPSEEYTITGEHDNKSLESVLESICFITNLKQKKDGNNIILY
ncbi:FecR domain-containing protein [Dysgonomonas sp. Marseille-P4677]|uniref:FecR family protein n=1 Tax=Dysgonomonas sp. Marseille-P4677 TaxID=2364790 RepID=UPI0019119FEF|nr:FecR domain-containing protein [Dysgonomonas sp. Marseille-P4677]MBK5721979.1 FecR domain-containing protein [Dysgonomonas sp. Marseille-P4677]